VLRSHDEDAAVSKRVSPSTPSSSSSLRVPSNASVRPSVVLRAPSPARYSIRRVRASSTSDVSSARLVSVSPSFLKSPLLFDRS
jgi:hypothetical protein